MEHYHEIKAYHNSYQTDYRNPFGAVICGQKILLKLEILSDVFVKGCSLRIWEHESQEKILPMRFIRKNSENGSTKQIYEIEYQAPREPGLVWYYFIFSTLGETYYYGDNKEMLGGQGELSQSLPHSYQIMVHKPMAVPDWYKTGIMYQIFVDRFRNGNPDGKIANLKKRSLIHGDWTDTPFYLKTSEGKIDRWNFFGGNLKGVIEKIPYLEELGVSILYLNPIFEAASNHKYDTGDYFKIDPMFGDEQIFDELIRKAAEAGISIILDGVFSHTGSDSIYFNKYGNYYGLGAYQSESSPYHRWYKFDDHKIHYDSWWGIEDLPTINKEDPSFQDFIFGSGNSVARHWIRKGVKGWRLDVVDELPDDFVRKLRQAVKETDPQAVLIGEVWEDASHKVSYGKLREYFWGDELDSVMNYPLRSILLDFMLGKNPAGLTAHKILCLLENYPKENFNANMNLIGSHDKERILTLLGDAPDPSTLTEEQKAGFKLSVEARKKAAARLKIMVLFQMTMPGVPCIYYGDEAGLEGYADPYNRGTYPWGREDMELLNWHKKMTSLRREYDIFHHGRFTPIHRGDDLFGLKIKSDEEELLVYYNRNAEQKAEIHCESTNGKKLVLELLSGEKIKKSNLLIDPLEAKVLYSRKHTEGLKQLGRRSGILMHPTSLHTPWGIGDLGQSSRDFIDFLVDSGQSLWQILPLNPVGQGNSPYQSHSVFAGNTLLISMEKLMTEGLLAEADLKAGLAQVEDPGDKVDFQGGRIAKDRLLKKAFFSFLSMITKSRNSDYVSMTSYQRFQEEQNYWLEDFSLYNVLKEKSGGKPWYEWEPAAASRDGVFLRQFKEKHSQEVEFQKFLQYTFYHQWAELKAYANERGISIIGDLPIYVAGDSAATWTDRRYFDLDSNGRAISLSGVPPDYFCENGQLWGNPLYNWRAMEKDGYAWWKRRVRNALGLYDYLRLDHFRGFEGYWSIPAGETTAVNGRWIKGPGKKLFDALASELGPLPFIVEDLGFITPEVNNLKNILGYPGMTIYQFSEEELALKTAELENTILYSGTHDTDTLLGWYKEKKMNGIMTAENLDKCYDILAGLYETGAPWVIIPMQDVLMLDTPSRMNIPGIPEGNWGWMLRKGEPGSKISRWLRGQAEKNKRNSL